MVTKGFEEKVAEAVELLAAIPGITREQADVLVHHGLTRLEDLLQADESDLADIPRDRRAGRRRFWKRRAPKPRAGRFKIGETRSPVDMGLATNACVLALSL